MVRNRVGLGLGCSQALGPVVDVATTVVATVIATAACQFKSV